MLSRSVSLWPVRAMLAAGLVAVVCATWAGTAAAQSAGNELICEATGNPSAPYVEISVPQGDLGNYSAGEGDIIPAPAAGCPASGGSVAPVETTATSTSAATSSAVVTTATSTAAASADTSSTTPVQTGAVSGSSTSLAATNPDVQTTTATATTTSSTSADAASLTTLPRTGGQVPLTLALGLLALVGGVLLRWTVVRQRQARSGR